MKSIRLDSNGTPHCWHCYGTEFQHKRTLGSKVALGIGALLTNKKLKCLTCGEWNGPLDNPSSAQKIIDKRKAVQEAVRTKPVEEMTDFEYSTYLRSQGIGFREGVRMINERKKGR